MSQPRSASRIFAAAADLPPEERSRYLQETCGDDAALQIEHRSGRPLAGLHARLVVRVDVHHLAVQADRPLVQRDQRTEDVRRDLVDDDLFIRRKHHWLDFLVMPA